LIYYKGDFSPPHKGHLESIEKFAKYKNVQFLLYFGDSEEKHGIPREVCKEIFKIYIKELYPFLNVTIKDLDSSYSDLLKFDVDTIIYIRGNENFDKVQTNLSLSKTFREIRKKLTKKHIIMDYLFIERRENLSSTSFCQAIISSKDTDNYFPENLPIESKTYILNLLSEYKIK
jgi:hypothetical protein